MNTLKTKIMIFVLFLSVSLSAQGLLPKLGEQRAGTASMTFLKIGVGARATSLGGAYIAISDDASSLYWNPAGVVQVDKNELVVSHSDWLIDISYEYLGYVHQVNSRLGVGVFIGYLHLADMPVTTEYHPYGNGEFFTYNDMVTGLTGSFRMTDRFSFGITLKYVREQLDDIYMDGMMADFGTFYWTGFKSLRLAAAMRNFGPDMRPGGSFQRKKADGHNSSNYQSFSPPTLFSMGAAMDVYKIKEHVLTAAIQMDHPMDDQENYLTALEYHFQNVFFTRMGYRANFEENPWTFGAGFRIAFWGKYLKIDYSYADFTNLTMTQQFTFGFEF